MATVGVPAERTGSDELLGRRSSTHTESHQIWPYPRGSADLTAADVDWRKRTARWREKVGQTNVRAVVAAVGIIHLNGKTQHEEEEDRP